MQTDIPLLDPPPGVKSNFKDPESWAYESIATTAVCFSLMVPFFVLRMYARAFVTRSLGWDDYTCALGVMSAIAYAGVFTNMVNYGFGLHGWDILLSNFVDGLNFLLVFTMLYGPTMFFIRISVLLLYRRLFYPDRWMAVLVHIGIGYLLITNGVFTIIFGALYVPRNEERSNLIKYHSAEYIDNIQNLSTAVAVCNLLADSYIHFLPVPIIWKLQMSTKKRYALIGLFTSGFLVCLASLASVVLRLMYSHYKDYTYWSPRMIMTSIIEMNVAIICSCMPACAALYRHPPTECLRSPSFEPLKSWFSTITARLVSNKSTIPSLEPAECEKAEGVLPPSEESDRGLGSGLVGLSSASSLSHNVF